MSKTSYLSFNEQQNEQANGNNMKEELINLYLTVKIRTDEEVMQ
jgi:hypothetical protein